MAGLDVSASVPGLDVSAPVHGVIGVELCRPPDNLMTVEMCGELSRILRQPPPGAHVLRLRARGAAFCLGRERAGSTPGELRQEARVLADVHRAFRETGLVTVAEVQGDAAGFGVGLVASCDVAVAVAGAHFSFPEVTIELAPALVLAWLPRAVGERQAFWLTATGEPVSAGRAAELGMLNEVVPSAEALTDEVDRRVAMLREHSPRVHAEIRELLRATGTVGEDQALELAVDRLVVGSLRRGEAS